MKVNLIQKASFEFNVDKMTPIPMNVFDTLAIATDNKKEDLDALPRVQFFKTSADYAYFVKNNGKRDFDEAVPVYVNDKGNIFVTMKPLFVSDKSETTTSRDNQPLDDTKN